MNIQPIETQSVEQTVELGRQIASVLCRGDVIALSGELGAGKTQFVRGLAEGVGADPRQVSSPTFTLMCEYEAETPLIHIDAYRIESLADLESIGFEAELLDHSITVIEWSERIMDDLPNDRLGITLEHVPKGRRLTFTLHGAFAVRTEKIVDRIRAAMAHKPAFETCRICGGQASPNQTNYPFCSDRCRLVDLNRWFNSQYALSRPVTDEDDIRDI